MTEALLTQTPPEVLTNIAAPPERVITAMVTPFDSDGNLNREGAQELAHHLMNNGSDGLVLAGTTGESPTLTADEQLSLFDVVRDAVGTDFTLIGGTGSNNTEEAIELSIGADRRGSVSSLLVVSPYYNRPSQHGIKDYYRDIAIRTPLPILLYNIPVRTGRAVELDTVRELFERGHITGLKDATGNTEMVQQLSDEYGSDITLYSGDDGLNLEFVRAGAIGAISVASHWAGKEISAMFEAHFRGDNEAAEAIEKALRPSCEFESTHYDEEGKYHDTPNPIPAKVMMAKLLGADMIGRGRPPMTTSREEWNYLQQRAGKILEDLSAAQREIGL